MEGKFKDHIRKNFVDLIDSTVNFDVLLILLYSNSILSGNELELIKSQTTSQTKCFDMYTKLMKRNCYYQLITCLEGSENFDAAKILKSSPPYDLAAQSNPTNPGTTNATNDSDFIVSSKGITGILDVLAKQIALYDNWEIIAHSLVTEISWSKLKEQKNFPVLVFQTLKTWIADKDQNATFDSLYELIYKWDKQAARILLQEKNSIRERN